MDQEIGRFDSAATRETEFVYPVSTLSPGIAVYSYSTPMPSDAPTGISKEATLSFPAPTASASYRPRPPHIAVPTPSHTISGAVNNRIGTGVIVGIVLGALTFVIATGAIISYLCYRKRLSRARKQVFQDSWMDLENKDTSDIDSLPPYDEVKALELCASAHYTKYVPRTLGRLSPVSQMVPPTFDLIKEHHFSSDRLIDPKAKPTRDRACQHTSPGYLNDIELTVTPFDTLRFSKT